MKINALTLNNFRAFPGPNDQTFALDGKNLLVYGENGAGKSSVFHALKTFFSFGLPNDVGETCNAFSHVLDHWIEVEFDDGQPPARWDGPPAVPTRLPDVRVLQAALRRGCLDYKSLLDTNYGQGDNTINLFQIAVGPLLGDYSVPISGGGSKTISNLWEAVVQAKPSYNSRKAIEAANVACLAFNQGFSLALEAIQREVDRLLDALPVQEAFLNRLNFSGVFYDRDARNFGGTALEPVMSLRGHTIDRPQHFLNEARLSALGLAIYLAGRLTSVPTSGSDLKLLVMDDVLIGIDLSNRLPLLDLLRERFADWQIVLLTHDRVWFEMARMHTQGGGKWNSVEIFDRVCAERGIPCPVVRKVSGKVAKGCLDDAKRFLDDPRGPYEAAAANYARSGFELTLKAFCEHHGVPVRYKQEARYVTSEDFLGAAEDWLRDKQKPFLDASLERVKMFRSVVLNQGSHSGPPNIARSEIAGAIAAVEALLKLTERNTDTDADATAKATELANGTTREEWIASLGYVRGAFAVKVRKFCKDKSVKVKFGEYAVKPLWKAVHDDHAHRFTGGVTSLPVDIEGKREWYIDPITDAQLQGLTQADLHALIAILDQWP